MNTTNRSTAVRTRFRHGIVAAVFASLWWLLAGGEPASWWVGGPVVLTATWLLSWLSYGAIPGPRLSGVVGLVPLFVRDSLSGALAVARQAASPRAMPVPRRVCWPLDLPRGGGRLLFLNLVSLMPGTLSMADRGDALVIHLLDGSQDVAADLARLEARVRGTHRQARGERQ